MMMTASFGILSLMLETYSNNLSLSAVEKVLFLDRFFDGQGYSKGLRCSRVTATETIDFGKYESFTHL